MSDYPMTFSLTQLRHRGGTKEYHVLRLTKQASGESLVIFRWGKVDSWGQTQPIRKTDFTAADKLADDKINEKEKGGYREIHAKHETVGSERELWGYIKESGYHALIKPWLTGGAEEAKADATPSEPIPVPSRAKAPPKPARDTFYDNDPMWGAF